MFSRILRRVKGFLAPRSVVTHRDVVDRGWFERRVHLHGGHEVIVRRVGDGRRDGVSAAWPSKVGARELFELCMHRDRARDLTEIVIFIPGQGSELYGGTIEEFLGDRTVDGAITRFNTPNWSMVVWPAAHTARHANMVEYTGQDPTKEFLTPILDASLPDVDTFAASTIFDKISEFNKSADTTLSRSAG